MRWLLFLSRLAFICGLFFLLTFSIEMKDWIGVQSINSTVFIIGLLGAFIIPLVNLCYLVVLVIRKNLSAVPLWLSLSNLLFLILQLIFVIYLNIHK